MLECRLDSSGLEHDPGAVYCEHSRKFLSIVATINFSRRGHDCMVTVNVKQSIRYNFTCTYRHNNYITVCKGLLGTWRCSYTHFLMDMSGQLHHPAALPPGKILRYPLNRTLDALTVRYLLRRLTQRCQLIPVDQIITTAFQISHASSIQQVAGWRLNGWCKQVRSFTSQQLEDKLLRKSHYFTFSTGYRLHKGSVPLGGGR